MPHSCAMLPSTRADSGSHFVTPDPRRVTWSISQLTRDPWPCPIPWQELITTTYKSWWVHDYCLLQSGINVMGDWVLLSKQVSNKVIAFINTNSKSSSRRACTAYNEKTMLNLLHVYTSHNHRSSVLQYWPVTHSHLSTHLTHDQLTHCLLCHRPTAQLWGMVSQWRPQHHSISVWYDVTVQTLISEQIWLPVSNINKALRYCEEHTESIVISWCTLWHFPKENLLTANQPLLRNSPQNYRFSEITKYNGHYDVHGHSRSPIY